MNRAIHLRECGHFAFVEDANKPKLVLRRAECDYCGKRWNEPNQTHEVAISLLWRSQEVGSGE